MRLYINIAFILFTIIRMPVLAETDIPDSSDISVPPIPAAIQASSTADIVIVQDTSAADPLQKVDSTSKPYELPFGDISFADSVILYDPGALGMGTGDEPDSRYQKHNLALGPPDADPETSSGFVSLGRGGNLIIKFTDNLLIDGPGPDLIIYEAAPDTEKVHVWISQDGVIFLPVGQASRAQPVLDIQKVADSGSKYPFVKIRDDFFTGDKEGPALGADIDAIGAMQTAIPIILPVDDLFIENTSNFKENASSVLTTIAAQIRKFKPAQVDINAYSDTQGDETYNLILSQVRAGKIEDFFTDIEQLTQFNITANGLGESQPVDSNDTEKGRKNNRRIEIYLSTK